MKRLYVLAGMLVAAMSASASLTITYSVEPVKRFIIGDPEEIHHDTFELMELDGVCTPVVTTLTLDDNVVQTSPLNRLYWWADGLTGIDESNGTLTVTYETFGFSRNINLNGDVRKITQQGVDIYSTSSHSMSIQPGAPLVFNFPSGKVTVTPLGYLNVADLSSMAPKQIMSADFRFTPVPEPTTMIAGALLLLPFGVSAVRGLRRKAGSPKLKC